MFKDKAEIIIKQLGGQGKLKAMIGMNNLSYDSKENYVSFRFKGNPKLNYARITLNGYDLYDLELYRIRKFDFEKIVRIENIYAEDLKEIFENETKLYLSL